MCEKSIWQIFVISGKKQYGGVVPRTRAALLRLALRYSVVPLHSAHKSIPYKDSKESRCVVTSRGRARVALLRLALCYSVVPLRSAHKPIPYKDSKESRCVVTSRGRTSVALLRLALCYSVVPLHSAHKPIPYRVSESICANQRFFCFYLYFILRRVALQLEAHFKQSSVCNITIMDKEKAKKICKYLQNYKKNQVNSGENVE